MYDIPRGPLVVFSISTKPNIFPKGFISIEIQTEIDLMFIILLMNLFTHKKVTCLDDAQMFSLVGRIAIHWRCPVGLG